MPLHFIGAGAFGSAEANWIKLEELVQAERARDPRLSLEQARARVYATVQGRRFLAAYRAAAKSAVTPDQVVDRKNAVWTKIDAAAKAVRKRNPSLSLEQARDQVMKSNPGLVASYRGEATGAIIGAPRTESDWLRRLEISKSDRTIRELAEDRLTELTKAEQARNQQLVKLDPSVKALTREQAFVVAVMSPEGREAYQALRRPDADMSPLEIRKAEDDHYARLMQSLEQRINPAPAPTVSPEPTVVEKLSATVAEEPAKTWIGKAEFGAGPKRLQILLEPGGTSDEIQKAMLEAPEYWHCKRDTVFAGREIKAGTVVGIWPVDDVAA